MSNEATVQSSLRIAQGNLTYRSPVTSYKADVAGANGPTPGTVLAATTPGTDVSLSELTALGGLCEIRNLDATNFVTVGSWDGAVFHPLLELKPGEQAAVRLSRYLRTSMSGTALLYTLRLIADTAACRVNVMAFDP